MKLVSRSCLRYTSQKSMVSARPPIYRAWLSAAGISLVRAAVVLAQDAAPEPMAETERVIVTGSHIPTAEESGPNPVLNN